MILTGSLRFRDIHRKTRVASDAAKSGRVLRGRQFSDADMHFAALEFDAAVGEGEEGVVTADADVEAGLELGAALADDDGAGGDDLPAVGFDAAVLRVAVAAVAGRSL